WRCSWRNGDACSKNVHFSLLNPWLLFGALAVAGPIWLHLRRRNERNVLRFSAVRFLQDHAQPRRSPLQLRDTWVLLLRVLAVLLIVAAFSWPYLHRRNTLTVRESVVYILDNTLSHQANNGFKTDRNRIVEELGNAGPDVQLAVIELTSTPRVVASFGDDRAASRQKVQALEPSFQRGSYLAAFREANSLLDNSLTQKKRIALLADNQANQWDENIKTPPFLKNVQLDLPKPASEQLPNLWLSDLRAQWIFLGEKSMLNFTLRLGHLGSAREAKVVLRLDEKVVFNRTVDLEKQPKNILLQAQCEADPTSWVR